MFSFIRLRLDYKAWLKQAIVRKLIILSNLKLTTALSTVYHFTHTSKSTSKQLKVSIQKLQHISATTLSALSSAMPALKTVLSSSSKCNCVRRVVYKRTWSQSNHTISNFLLCHGLFPKESRQGELKPALQHAWLCDSKLTIFPNEIAKKPYVIHPMLGPSI